MKIPHLLTALALTLAPALAGPGHGATPTGPTGGRLLTTMKPAVEFLVLPDRRVRLTFVDEAVVSPGDRIATVTTGERSAPVRLTFQAEGESLVSENPLPDGKAFPVILQIQSLPGEKPALAKFQLDLSICGGCKKPEYVCSCEHTH